MILLRLISASTLFLEYYHLLKEFEFSYVIYQGVICTDKKESLKQASRARGKKELKLNFEV